jgi:hypothetical protein
MTAMVLLLLGCSSAARLVRPPEGMPPAARSPSGHRPVGTRPRASSKSLVDDVPICSRVAPNDHEQYTFERDSQFEERSVDYDFSPYELSILREWLTCVPRRHGRTAPSFGKMDAAERGLSSMLHVVARLRYDDRRNVCISKDECIVSFVHPWGTPN